MRLAVRVLGTELVAVEWDHAPAPAAGPGPEAGLTEDGAPKRHETHTAATTQLGFRGRSRAEWMS